MHPTADTRDVINLRRAARRVMPGVRLLWRYNNSADRRRGRSRWRDGMTEATHAMMFGLTSTQAGDVRHGGGRSSPPDEPGGAWWAKGGPQSNKRMHATRDTSVVMYTQRGGRARDARR